MNISWYLFLGCLSRCTSSKTGRIRNGVILVRCREAVYSPCPAACDLELPLSIVFRAGWSGSVEKVFQLQTVVEEFAQPPCYSAVLWICPVSSWPPVHSPWMCRQCRNVHPTNIIKDSKCKLSHKTFSSSLSPRAGSNIGCLNNSSLTDQFHILICKTSGVFFSSFLSP